MPPGGTIGQGQPQVPSGSSTGGAAKADQPDTDTSLDSGKRDPKAPPVPK
jgi:hypothetical protein